MPRNASGRKRSGARLRRRDRDPADIVLCGGLRVTAAPLAAIEAAVGVHGERAATDRALQDGTGLRQLWDAHLRNKGRYGSPAARILLQAAADGTHSEAERLLGRLLKSAKLTGRRSNVRIGGDVVDVVFREAKVAIEVDGWAFHSDQEAFQSDRERQNHIGLRGWQVLRFTWLDLTEYPDKVMATIRGDSGVVGHAYTLTNVTEVTGGGR